jgi:AraC-like DNA-binding protein
LQNASERLLQTEESVITIALDCGYSHIPYFNKIFKEKYGVSPTQYRKKHRFV